MDLFDRIMLTVYMLSMVFISLCIAALPFNIIPQDSVLLFINELYSKWYYSIGGIILFIISLKLLLSGIGSNRKIKGGIIRATEFGNIKISVQTFESLAIRAIQQIKGVRDTKVNIVIDKEQLIIVVRLFVLSDINIPKVITEVQSRVKNYIEAITEIAVKEIRVSVENIAQSSVIRVE